MKVAEAMRRQFHTVAPEDSVQGAAQTLAEGDDRVLLVLDGEGRVVGIVTERDITVRAVAGARRSDETRVVDIMSRDVFACAPEDDADSLVQTMRERQIDQAPVLQGGRLVGLLFRADLCAGSARARPAAPGG